MQSDLFIIINTYDIRKLMHDNDNNLPGLVKRLGRSHVKSIILSIIKDYIYKEKHSISIDILDKESYYVYKHSTGGKDKSLIKTLLLPRIEEALMGVDFIKLTEKGLNLCLDGLLSKNTFMLQLSFIENK